MVYLNRSGENGSRSKSGARPLNSWLMIRAAAGKSWEAWVRKYWERKAAGEKGIALEPEKLD